MSYQETLAKTRELASVSIDHRETARGQSRRDATTLIVLADVRTLLVCNRTLVGGSKRKQNQRQMMKANVSLD